MFYTIICEEKVLVMEVLQKMSELLSFCNKNIQMFVCFFQHKNMQNKALYAPIVIWSQTINTPYHYLTGVFFVLSCLTSFKLKVD